MRACYDSLCGTEDSYLSSDVLMNKRPWVEMKVQIAYIV